MVKKKDTKTQIMDRQKSLALLARPRGFEPLTLGLEMRGFVITNSTELSRFVTLQ